MAEADRQHPPLGVVIVGCGNIAGRYAETLRRYPEVRLLGATDIDPARAEALVAEHGGTAYPSLEAVLEDPSVQAVVNLTIHHAHAAVTRRALEAGRHVHSEKPLALRYDEAEALVRLASDRGLRLSCAPITFMGEAQQTAWRLVRDGRLGTVRVAYAEANWGRIESWHPAPAAFYEVGALWDVGVYPLTILTTLFGPAGAVLASGTVLLADRATADGTPFHVTTPDLSVAVIELLSGVVIRLTTNFYVSPTTQQRGIELHGDRASLHLESWQEFASPLWLADFGEEYRPVELVRPAYAGIEWGRGVEELAQALAEGRPQRATGAQAAHVVEILEAIGRSTAEGRRVELCSTFDPPEPMDWAR